jgi:hypothetical protein
VVFVNLGLFVYVCFILLLLHDFYRMYQKWYRITRARTDGYFFFLYISKQGMYHEESKL